jgi:DNA-directed RNA polymerase specialized sigma24 family protein
VSEVDERPFLRVIEIYKESIRLNIRRKIYLKGEIEDVFQEVCIRLWKFYCKKYNKLDLDAEPKQIIYPGVVRRLTNQAIVDHIKNRTKEDPTKFFVKKSDFYWDEFLEIFSQNRGDSKVVWIKKYVQENLGEAELQRNIDVCLRTI